MKKDLMTKEYVFQKIKNLNIAKRNGVRAPHKPLLILLAISKLPQRKFLLSDISKKLVELLKEFGPKRQSYYPELPFWHLANDGVWEIENRDKYPKKCPSKSYFAAKSIMAGFPKEIHRLLSEDQHFCHQVIKEVLNCYFPQSTHDDILDSLGLSTEFNKDQVVETNDKPEKNIRPKKEKKERCTNQESLNQSSDVKVFVAMPFNPVFLPVWRVIKKTCKANDLDCCRVDQLPQIDNIHDTIFQEIDNSDIVIVDFSPDSASKHPNPNVVTEATYAKLKKKPLLILSQLVDSLPFDWRTHRAVIYENNRSGLEYLEEVLEENLAGVKSRLSSIKH
ncbi:hypothetical protein [Candidatus Uabimicrobium amorphum]|uniref:HNH endonuclease n=1 Tax=Uabimicrobium amorphum TaxID=2596890 RepID=A0A5S9F5J8_UABAM|nr:hypothetical protein [Candidatus Uabimicrobium amorphum]BBM85332.1 HNH endonuclease [Candidatus Uabimicrobium amorphum]